MKKQDFKNGKIVIYKTYGNKVELKVALKEETIWLTQTQIASIFDSERSVITKHLRNIFKEGELHEDMVCAFFAHTTKHGAIKGKTQTQNVKFYNLDAIISVGYRVNSQIATQFRIWATKILNKYLVKGYTINEKCLLEEKNKFHELQEIIFFLQEQSKRELLKGQEIEILNLLANYSKTLSLLEKYDEGRLCEQKGAKTKFILKYEACQKIITELKKELTFKKETGNLFGRERDGSFKGMIKGLYQTFDKKELYPTIEDKASHLLYFIIKDHPFSDGNKRSAAFLFVYFLDKTNYLFKKSGERKINDNALTALALLIAESDPKDKEVMIKIIKNLITEYT